MITVIFLPIKVKLYRYLQRSRLQRTQVHFRKFKKLRMSQHAVKSFESMKFKLNHLSANA
jgi:hypothetical protein